MYPHCRLPATLPQLPVNNVDTTSVATEALYRDTIVGRFGGQDRGKVQGHKRPLQFGRQGVQQQQESCII